MRDIDRRLLLQLGTFGVAALALPGAASAAFFARGFTHGVASGEPSPHSVLLWTRYVASGDTRLTAELSETADFARVAGGGSVDARGEADHTAKLVVAGLAPDRWYYYRFVAPDGTASQTGRTRTLPDDRVSDFRLALFSCANLPFGWFNAYAHAAARDDIDLVLHVGDYFYEYRVGTYPSLAEALPGRAIQPNSETIILADYRLRYASYRADRDLQALHQMAPMIAQPDDHEFANDAWQGSAENHDPANEGDWALRKAAAARAYAEWMPVSEVAAKEYRIGDLATLTMPETRITGRDQQPDLGAALAGGGDIGARLVGFRDDIWADPARSMMGAAQEAWIADRLKASVASGTRWQVVPQQVLMGNIVSPPESGQWIGSDAPDYLKSRVAIGLAAAKVGLPFNFDSWGGYPAARERLLTAALDANANFVTLAGDSHNAWAFDLAHQGAPAGVEIGGHSVTSPGFEANLPNSTEATRVAALRRVNPELKWAETSRRGYVTVAIARDRIDSEFVFMDTIRDRSLAVANTHRETVRHGANSLDPQ